LTLLKVLVLCLGLANIGYFLWTQGVGKSPELSAPAVPTLKLKSETINKTPSTQAGAPTNNKDLITDVKRCITVGPFPDVSEAAHAATTLRAGGYDPRQRVAEGEIWAGVWVYLPLPSTRAATEQILAKLKAGGVDDALEMPGPSDGSVISLGLFSESKRAQARVTQAQSMGFNPGIADRKRMGDVYWVDIDLKPTDSLLKPSDLQSEAGRIVRLEVKACPVSQAAQP